ncbi:MAG TPA: DNA-deoxyinosine glycosylase [Allosphingosinicella sp.]|nr:DNA-deoxyinosine glycosylase [Allosphingosinicella sp.]
MMDEIKRSFPPVVDKRTRLLVLGSLPGEESLAGAQYYANPRNHFWRLIGAVTGVDLAALPYEARLAALLEARVGLWDTIGSAIRSGSLDAAIRDHRANDLADLAARLPELRAVGFNGGKSAALGRSQLAGRPDLALIPLPSSSPAYTRPFDEKLAEWMKLAPYLRAEPKHRSG